MGCHDEYGFITHYDPNSESRIYNCGSSCGVSYPYYNWDPNPRPAPMPRDTTHPEEKERTKRLRMNILNTKKQLNTNPDNDELSKSLALLINEWNMGDGEYCGGCKKFLSCHIKNGFKNHHNTREMGGPYDCHESSNYGWY